MRRGVSSAVTALLVVAAACVQLGPRKDLSRFFVLSPEPVDSTMLSIS